MEGTKRKEKCLLQRFQIQALPQEKQNCLQGQNFSSCISDFVYVFLKIRICIKHWSRADTSQAPLHEMLQIDCSILEKKAKLNNCYSSCCGVLLCPFVTCTNSLKVCSQGLILQKKNLLYFSRLAPYSVSHLESAF